MDDNWDVANLAAGGSKKYGISLGSNPYNPGAIQAQIKSLLSQVSKGHPLSMAQLNYVMSLCGTYRSDVVGNDAAELAQINKYFTYIQDLTTQLNNASTLSTSSVPAPANINNVFYNDVMKLSAAILTGHFFTKGAGSSLAPQISGALTNVLNAAFGQAGPGGWSYGNANLQQLWLTTSGSNGVSGDPGPMNQLNQGLGSVSQIYTGVSKSAQAQIQSDNSILTAVNNAIASLEKKILDILSASVNAQTRGS